MIDKFTRPLILTDHTYVHTYVNRHKSWPVGIIVLLEAILIHQSHRASAPACTRCFLLVTTSLPFLFRFLISLPLFDEVLVRLGQFTDGHHIGLAALLDDLQLNPVALHTDNVSIDFTSFLIGKRSRIESLTSKPTYQV